MFVSINSQLQNCGEAISTTPPTSADVFTAEVTASSATTGATMSITLGGGGSADDFAIISFSRPQSSGVAFCKSFWQQTVVAGDSATANNVYAGYTAQFGVAPAGTRIFYKITPVNQYGVTGVPVIGFITVA